MEAKSEKKSASGEISHTSEKSRAIVYIDGLNLYNGIKRLGNPLLKWLDIGKLGASLADGECTVKYFTAPVRGKNKQEDDEKQERRSIYHSALRAACPLLQITEGDTVTKDIWYECCATYEPTFMCHICGTHNKIYQEKRTDVNLAFHLTKDFVEGAFERAFVVSGDGDFMLPVSEIAAAPGREMILATPPGSANRKLIHQANRHIDIDRKRLEECLLSDPVVGKKKKIYSPPEWRAASR